MFYVLVQLCETEHLRAEWDADGWLNLDSQMERRWSPTDLPSTE
jgi:hypothetical protein